MKSIENSNYEFKTDKMTIDNKENGDIIVTTNRNNKLTEKISKESQTCDSLCASFQEKKQRKALVEETW